MASIAIMVGGAVLNTTAFIGGNYLARATKLHLKKKSTTTELLRRTKQLTPNTCVTAPIFLTGF